jgi:hypothetical protein
MINSGYFLLSIDWRHTVLSARYEREFQILFRWNRDFITLGDFCLPLSASLMARSQSLLQEVPRPMNAETVPTFPSW